MMNEIDQTAQPIEDSAYRVHSKLGPDLLESAYEACMAQELTKRGFRIERQKPQPVIYDDLEIEVEYRIDILVEGKIIIELKAVEQLAPIHQAQLMAYLRLSNNTLGFLINFNVPLIKQGIRRIANDFQES